MRRFGGTSIAAITLAATLSAGTAQANDTLPPSSWPNTTAIKPRLDGWPHAIRLSGDDRYQTGLAAALTLRGKGAADSYPFGTPDPSSTTGWYGLDTCPRAILIVAGDSPADALSASSLSDPTGNSSEPYLQRSAAADPLFDPPGGFQKVDTDFAPILITRSARQGATALNLATRLAAQDLRNGGCTSARQAVVVGGTSAIPASVENELVAIGYEQVFRVAGSSRYETAKKVAESLGTAVAPGNPTPSACTDPLTDDGNARMKFYANSVVEYRNSAQQCTLLQRSVVLTDGIVGADALAAGWWTSFWQVPVLLHDGSDALPSATAQALQTLSIDNVIVLGGTGRISDSVAQQAASAASASVTRVSGESRYDTSVAMAQKFGGWYATGRGTEFAGSQVCIASSSGGSSTSAGTGWADALAAGPWCGRASARGRNAPARALAPTTGANPVISTTASTLTRPAHDAVPVLLVPVGATDLPTVVDDFLAAAFNPADNWCTSVAAPAGCLAPGFAAVFGGASLVPDAVVNDVAKVASGGTALGSTDRSPSLSSVFHTTLSMAPVFDDPAAANGDRACAGRGGYSRARWLVAVGSATSSLDVMTRGRYTTDADTTVRTPGTASPACVPVTVGASGQVAVRAVGLAGPASANQTLTPSAANRLSLANAIAVTAPSTFSGVDSALNSSGGGATTWTFTTQTPAAGIVSKGASTSVSQASVTLTLTRGLDTATQTGPDTFSATFSLVTPLGTVTGTASGEAVLAAGVWKLRGEAVYVGGSWNVAGGRGGFVADLTAGAAGLVDDSASWRVDGLVA
ncbi:MAG: cell wall-binding repeat-containing protein [Ilumatobacteraceae bacterium]